jgi:hypothetical protein
MGSYSNKEVANCGQENQIPRLWESRRWTRLTRINSSPAGLGSSALCVIDFFLTFLESYFLFTSIQIWINSEKLKRREERERLRAIISMTLSVTLQTTEWHWINNHRTWSRDHVDRKRNTYISLKFPSSCMSNASTMVQSIDSFFYLFYMFNFSSKLFSVYFYWNLNKRQKLKRREERELLYVDLFFTSLSVILQTKQWLTSFCIIVLVAIKCIE